MSCFPGKLFEYPFVSIDRFNKENLDSSIFFLSHCHEDHMIGLGNLSFSDLLEKMNYKLYCHEITAKLLCCDKRYLHLEPYVHPLRTNEPYVLDIPSSSIIEKCVSSSNIVCVTLLPAFHCPGSVMFLLEGSNGVVLYTGDFRLSRDDFMKMELLKSVSGVKAIDTLYLDTTFCTIKTENLPSRDESFTALLAEVKTWLLKSPNHKVLLYTASKYGHEFLFCQLYKHLKEKIHVCTWKAKAYESIAVLRESVTTDSKVTRIHACVYWNFDDDADGGALLCPNAKRSVPITVSNNAQKNPAHNYCSECSPTDPCVLTIKPSVMFFQQLSRGRMIKWVTNNFVRVCYSMHSSLREIRDLVSYLNPKKIRPNVIPLGSSEQEVINLLNGLICTPPSLALEGKFDSPLRADFQKFISLGNSRKRQNQSLTEDLDDLFEDCPSVTKKQI